MCNPESSDAEFESEQKMKSVRRMKERLKDATTIKVGSYHVNPFLYWRAWLTLLTPFVLAAVPLTLGSEV